MNTYFTSDWHIGHANVLKFDARPFEDLEHMHRVLVNNYNATVRPEDTCYFLGDMAMKCPFDVAKSVISSLNGTKVLLLGNHDRGAAVMRRMGFDVVMNTASIMVANQVVTMSHCPLLGVFREDITGMRGGVEGDHWHGESKYPHFSVQDFGQFHLHGHIHSGPHNTKTTKTDRQWDVGVAGNKYRPISIREVESWIMKTRKKEDGE